MLGSLRECNMNDLEDLINKKNIEYLFNNYSVEDLVRVLPFKKAMVLSKMLLENETWDSALQEYAVNLIEKLKQRYPTEWNKDWRHEAYLGYAYSALGFDIDKEFNAYSIASKKSINPPIEILMHMALLWSYPGIYKTKMDEERAIKILEQVANKTPYMEAVSGLIRLFEETGQVDKAEYWKKILNESEKNNICDQHLYLDFFNDYTKTSEA